MQRTGVKHSAEQAEAMSNKGEEDAAWQEARKRYRLSAEQVRMARQLGMNPKKLGKIANHKQEPWKAPLPVFIEMCYEKRFGASTARPSPLRGPAQLPTDTRPAGCDSPHRTGT